MNREIKFRAFDPDSKEIIPVKWNSVIQDDGSISSVNGVILMQYTGLEDKNGKEIYEGDVVRWFIPEGISREEQKFTGEVVFNQVMWELAVRRDDGSILVHQDLPLDSSSMEVISNVYENPDLIETK